MPANSSQMNSENPIERGKPEALISKVRSSIASSFSTFLALISLVLSTVLTVQVYLAPGALNIYKPTSFCIVRGYPQLGFLSDYLVVPFTVENTGRGVKTIDAPALVLTERTSGRVVVYTIAGILPDLNRNSRQAMYEEAFSLTTPSYSTERFIVVFHTQNWWDTTTSDYNFNFVSGERWDAKFVYINDEGVQVNWNNGATFTPIPIYGAVDNLKSDGSYTNECFPLRTIDLTGQPAITPAK